MLLPINTDAPIYHFPWVTIGLIVANTAAFAAWMAAGAPPEWMLVYGDGLHPVQWVSSVFLHGGPFHLVGNMFFLWAFGLVVEGKLGWWRFLTLYLGLTVVSCFIEQLAMLGYEGDVFDGGAPGSLGASGVIFGLMAMALVWAPKNDMTVFMLLFYQPLVFEASILAFCGFYLVWQVVLVALLDWSAVLHMLGAVLGLAAGLVMLKANWVDCEGWDIFAVINNTYGRRDDHDEFRYRHAAFEAGKIATPQVVPEKPKSERVEAAALDPRHRIRRFLDAGDVISALGEYEKLVAFHPTWRLDREALLALAEAAYREKSWDDADPLMTQYLDRFPEDDPTATARVRLKLAKYQVDIAGNAAEALQLLRAVDPATLPAKAAAAHRELRKRAEAASNAASTRGPKPSFGL